jgi:PQQ-like domain
MPRSVPFSCLLHVREHPNVPFCFIAASLHAEPAIRVDGLRLEPEVPHYRHTALSQTLNHILMAIRAFQFHRVRPRAHQCLRAIERSGLPLAKRDKALNIRTGQIAWELPQTTSWGGTIATSSGLVFFGEEGGALMAADAITGKVLWSFQTNEIWKASPMTYTFDGRQYIAVAVGSHILSFGIQQ